MTEVLLFVARNCPDALKYLGKQDEVLSYVRHLKAQKTLPITKVDAKDINDVLESLGCTDELIKYGDEFGVRPTLSDDVGEGGSYTIKGEIGSGYNPLENIVYTDKVKGQMTLGDYHSFPEEVDGFGNMGKISKKVGGDGVREL